MEGASLIWPQYRASVWLKPFPLKQCSSAHNHHQSCHWITFAKPSLSCLLFFFIRSLYMYYAFFIRRICICIYRDGAGCVFIIIFLFFGVNKRSLHSQCMGTKLGTLIGYLNLKCNVVLILGLLPYHLLPLSAQLNSNRGRQIRRFWTYIRLHVVVSPKPCEMGP